MNRANLKIVRSPGEEAVTSILDQWQGNSQADLDAVARRFGGLVTLAT